jgi:hypothetical protein
MPIPISDPMEHDPQWVDVRTKKPIRKKKKLPPEILKIAEVIHFKLRHCVYTGGPGKLIAAPRAWELETAIAVVRAQQVIASDAGKKNIDKRHAAPGGAHDKAEAIRKAWASGKYSSRSICAEEEARALGMSYDAASKALRNQPTPSR